MVPLKINDIISLGDKGFQWFQPLELLNGFTIMDYKLTSPEEISK